MEKKPTLFGYGKTTKAIANLLGGSCIFFDDNTNKSYKDEMDNIINPSKDFNPANSTLEITTPSLKPSHLLITKAKNLVSEYDYFLAHDKKKPLTIWISGTNGKTTTTQMLTHMLATKGAVSGGNIGTPLAELDTNATIWVLETSSFTLHHTHKASPNIYLLLPITPDHLDWHGNTDEYIKAKLKPLLTMQEGQMALIPKGLPIPKTSAFVIEYDTNEFLGDYFGIDTTKIKFKGAFLQDALLALLVTKTLYDEIDYNLMNDFIVEGHRQEELQDAKGRLWVNDSKATNLDATIQAVKVYGDRPLHLILGGDDKGVELDELFTTLEDFSPTIYTIGANQEKLYTLAKQHNLQVATCTTIDNAIKLIDANLEQNGVALLSPAAASLDQFSSYEERGKVFKKLIHLLGK